MTNNETRQQRINRVVQEHKRTRAYLVSLANKAETDEEKLQVLNLYTYAQAGMAAESAVEMERYAR